MHKYSKTHKSVDRGVYFPELHLPQKKMIINELEKNTCVHLFPPPPVQRRENTQNNVTPGVNHTYNTAGVYIFHFAPPKYELSMGLGEKNEEKRKKGEGKIRLKTLNSKKEIS